MRRFGPISTRRLKRKMLGWERLIMFVSFVLLNTAVLFMKEAYLTCGLFAIRR